MTLNEIADLICSPAAQLLMNGNYLNRRGVRGDFAQFKCGNHWCSVSVSHADQHSARISLQELDDLAVTALSPTVTIPLGSIVAALKSSEAEAAPVGSYFGSLGVEGNWAEFCFRGNWNMVAVSHVDESALGAGADLERTADELLRQQGQRGLNPDFHFGRRRGDEASLFYARTK